MASEAAAFCGACGNELRLPSRHRALRGVKSTPTRRRRSIVHCARVQPLQLSPSLTVSPPVVLTAQAGVTDYPFRRLCREQGAGLVFPETAHAAGVLDGGWAERARFGPDETLRSVQLRGTDTAQMGAAAARLIAEMNVRHIDIDLACSAERVLRRGAGAAAARDPDLVRAIVSAVVDEASPHDVAVTVSLRLGLSWIELTYPEAAQAAQAAGVSAVTLVGRTVIDAGEDGVARRNWPHIKAIAGGLDIPVLGAGDVYTAAGALKMVKSTGVAGVAVGRGAKGRPWLFRDLKDAMSTGWAAETTVPAFGFVARTALRHLRLAIKWEVSRGGAESDAVRDMRKWYQEYFRGYNKLPHLFVVRLCKAESLEQVEEIMREVDQSGVGYKYEKGVGDRGKMGFMELPKRRVVEQPKKRKSASQRLPTTMKGQIQKALRERAKAEKEENIKKEKRKAQRKWIEDQKTMYL